MKPLHLIMCCVSSISRRHKFLNPCPKEFTDNDWSPCEAFHESYINFGHHCLNRVTTYDPNQLPSLTSQITKTLDFVQASRFIRSANALLKNRLYFCFQHSSVKRNTAMNVLLLKYSLSIFIFPPRKIKRFGTFLFSARICYVIMRYVEFLTHQRVPRLALVSGTSSSESRCKRALYRVTLKTCSKCLLNKNVASIFMEGLWI